jgi:hypothetical protein
MVLAVRQRGLNALKRADGERANDAGERMETVDAALYSGSEGFKRKGGYTMSAPMRLIATFMGHSAFH